MSIYVQQRIPDSKFASIKRRAEQNLWLDMIISRIIRIPIIYKVSTHIAYLL